MSIPKAHASEQTTIAVDDDEEDPVIRMLNKTGCADLHYELQECIAETRDWRKCQDIVAKFKKCMAKHSEKQQHPS